MRILSFLAAVALLFATSSLAPAQVVSGQVDTFESGTTLNWANGAPAADPTVQLGGPGGALDHYLRIATNGVGGGAGSLMIAFNRIQWIGNYTTAGVNAIDMDVRNFNVPGGMSVRVGLKTSTFGNAPGYVSLASLIPMDGLWHHVVFPLDSAGMVAVNGPPSLASVLAGGNGEMRILHNPNDDLNGASTPPIAAQLGVDNVRAISVPEPGALALTGLVIAWTVGSLRKARKAKAE